MSNIKWRYNVNDGSYKQIIKQKIDATQNIIESIIHILSGKIVGEIIDKRLE